METKSKNEIVTTLIDQIIKENLSTMENWATVVDTLGLDTNECENWLTIFKDAVKDVMEDLVNDAKACQTNLLNKIEILLKKSSALSKQLGIPMEEHGKENLGLYKEEKALRMKVLELENLVIIRKTEIDQIKTEQLNVCAILGRKPMEIYDNPLPKDEEISKIKNYVNMLVKEAETRKETFLKLRGEIVQKMNELKIEPRLDFERMVISSEVDNFSLTDESMKMLKSFHESVLQQAENMSTEIFDLREKVSKLWEILTESEQYCFEFGCKYTGNSTDVLEALKEEIARCQAKKRANIKIFIDKLRVDIINMWEKCAYSAEQREFEYLYDNLYSEDLLNLHEIELNKLTEFYQDNKMIFELLEKREKLWEKMIEIEERAQAPDRFKNRGGKLLKEEKERNELLKKIPKIEEKLLELAASYEIKNGKPFLYWGEEISIFITKAYQKHEEVKKLKLSTRKLKREVSPMRSATNLTRAISSQNLFKQTPLKGASRILQTPSTSSRKHTNKQDVSKHGSKSAPAKRCLNLNPKNGQKPKLRYSIEKKKRIEKMRRLSKLIKQKENIKNDLKYDSFEGDLSRKDGDCHSTFFLKPSITVTTPKQTTKALSTPKQLTPRALQNTSKFSSVKMKLQL